MVFKTVGDGVYAVFVSAPAALEIRHALQTEAWEATGPLRARMALHSGVARAITLGPRSTAWRGCSLSV
jgi:hypothetical protein